MFPTTATPATNIQAESNRTAVNRDFYNLDTLIGDLAVEKEEIRATPPPHSQHSAVSPEESHSATLQENKAEVIAPEIAALSGKAIANSIDAVLSTGFSLYAKAKDPDKFEASEKQMQKLSEAWAAVAKHYNYSVDDSPWMHVIALNAGIYIPKFNEAKNDRRFAEMDEKFKEMNARIEKLAAEARAKENEKPAA